MIKGEREELIQFKLRIEAERAVKERNVEIAKKMLLKKEPIKNISEYTGLTEKQVERLKGK